jgi:hypothetical protein
MAYKSKRIKEREKVQIIPNKTVTSKYNQAINGLIYYMLRQNKVIELAERKVVYVVNNTLRLLFNEIICFYHKYGTFIIADFFTYLSNQNELLESLTRINSLNLKETSTKEEIEDYIKVINEEVREIKIRNLEKKLKEETDPMIQLKILNEIAEIKGVNKNDRSN